MLSGAFRPRPGLPHVFGSSPWRSRSMFPRCVHQTNAAVTSDIQKIAWGPRKIRTVTGSAVAAERDATDTYRFAMNTPTHRSVAIAVGNNVSAKKTPAA